MNQNARLRFLISELLVERSHNQRVEIPSDVDAQKRLLRSLMNIRLAAPVTEKFERIQNEYLLEENADRGIIRLDTMKEVLPDIYLWQGDITRLKVNAIVNAANSGITGCYQPCHACIDNYIHSYAGVQLRNFCQKLMDEQGFDEPTGQAKITPAYNLPCDYVIHTVGPIVQGELTKEHERLLQSCYEACLDLADKNKIKSIAFCCISTGVFMFPNDRAAQIAVHTVKEFKTSTNAEMKVIFNVYKDVDWQIYKRLLR